jgi:hypothetical protein
MYTYPSYLSYGPSVQLRHSKLKIKFALDKLELPSSNYQPWPANKKVLTGWRVRESANVWLVIISSLKMSWVARLVRAPLDFSQPRKVLDSGTADSKLEQSYTYSNFLME